MTSKEDRDWERLMRIAAQLSVPLRRRFLAAVQDMKDSVSLSQLASWLENGQVDKIIEAYTGEAEKATLFRIAAQEATIGAAEATAELVPARVLFTFNPHNPLAVESIWNNGSRLIQQVTNDAREAVKLLVADGIQRGANPRETARLIRDGIGLTKSQLQAVANFRTYLEQGDPVALDRALRDKRFDPAIRASLSGKKQLSQAKIDDMVSAYYRRYVNYRAENIARTESINALSLGQKLAWEQVFQTGKLSEASARRFWYVALDERTCAICAPIPGINPNGVEWRASFQTPNGPIWGPTVHPQCRCVVFTRFL